MPKSIRLPSAARFAALPLSDRTAVFARWLKAQPRRKRYDYFDHSNCVLGTFGKAIFRSDSAVGGAEAILPAFNGNDMSYLGPGAIQVVEAHSRQSAVLHHSETFGAASDAFQEALNA